MAASLGRVRRSRIIPIALVCLVVVVIVVDLLR
jgi:hypothetical protein